MRTSGGLLLQGTFLVAIFLTSMASYIRSLRTSMCRVLPKPRLPTKPRAALDSIRTSGTSSIFQPRSAINHTNPSNSAAAFVAAYSSASPEG